MQAVEIGQSGDDAGPSSDSGMLVRSNRRNIAGVQARRGPNGRCDTRSGTAETSAESDRPEPGRGQEEDRARDDNPAGRNSRADFRWMVDFSVQDG
eukprot:CAMPEP_0172200940 /NCGR_PEP_ID=MMETSP1050-20130122/29664_1 /TAXON_ID=233186 /ORGANISM="Cryptomonas curvata, Strain CCAP979/52" /LENGTH=95 /DNA_ID=CAMNT_0012878413 /DNA_START=797 /DNA_END=1084 /DNA_ORIENTATION=+